MMLTSREHVRLTQTRLFFDISIDSGVYHRKQGNLRSFQAGRFCTRTRYLQV